jgi:hypothetical protein
MELQQQLDQLDQAIEELQAEKSRVKQAMKLQTQEVEAKRLKELYEYIERIVSIRNGLKYDFEDETFYYKKDRAQFKYMFSLDDTIDSLKIVEQQIDRLIYLYSVVLSQFNCSEDRSCEEDQVKVSLLDFNLNAEFKFKDESALEIVIENYDEDYEFEFNLDETTRLKVITSIEADIYISDKRLVYLDTDDAVEVMNSMIENVCNYELRLDKR